MKIAIVVALPDEWRNLKRLMGPWRKAAAEPFRTYVHASAGKIVTVIESGMGGSRVQLALSELQQGGRPELIMSCGFAGALSANTAVGDVRVGNRMVFGETGESALAETAFDFVPAPELLQFFRGHRVWPAPIVTVEKPQPKVRMAQIAAGRDFLMDMESYFVAEFAHRMGISLLCLRAVSDGVDDAIDYDLDAITDTRGRVQTGKVLRSLLRRPRLVGSFYRSWGGSRRASQNMGEVLHTLLSLPAARLRDLLLESHLFERKQT